MMIPAKPNMSINGLFEFKYIIPPKNPLVRRSKMMKSRRRF